MRKLTVPRKAVDSVEAINRDGIVVIEDFLSPKQFDKVSIEYEKTFRDIELRPYKNVANARLFRKQIALSETNNHASAIRECFQLNERLNEIASAIVRRKISRPPDVHLDWYQGCNFNALDNDIENILHADLHASTVKMFFYLDDVDESNGAFIYAKGSHRLNIGRLRHEYDLSIRQAKLRRGMQLSESLVERRGDEVRNVIRPKYRRVMRVEETRVCAKANTLVIANNMGFHRRGEFFSDRPRKTIQINYRYLEKPFGKHFLSRNSK